MDSLFHETKGGVKKEVLGRTIYETYFRLTKQLVSLKFKVKGSNFIIPIDFYQYAPFGHYLALPTHKIITYLKLFHLLE